MSNFQALLSPLKIDGLTLKNRVVMASLTRNRNIVPAQINVDHYSQRASSGLILSEGTLIEPQGSEWSEAPGIWSKEQIKAWKEVTDGVHANGGLIFCQLWHLGRVANTLHNSGVPPPAPSAIKAKGGKYRLLVDQPGHSVPKAIEDPKYYVNLFKQAAINSKEAGFDGVELHSANGYLVSQFLESHSNKRTDNYGGSIENRVRFGLEVIDAFIEIFGKDRVGIKLSPGGGANDMGEKTEQDMYDLYSHYIRELDARKIAYIQLMRYSPDFDPLKRGINFETSKFTALIKHAKIFLNGSFSAEEANKAIEEGKADAVTFGRPFISNSDLVERFEKDAHLNPITSFTSLYLYEGDSKHVGYNDYPVLA